MKVALVYDRVNKFGGAERVLETLKKIFPLAPLYTLVYDSKKATWSRNFRVIPTFLNTIPMLRNKHEWLSPVAPMAFESLSFSDYDVVISITSADAKSVITKPNTLHICYCLTPTRYFWSGKSNYKDDLRLRIIPKWLKRYFQMVDIYTSKRPDKYIAISNEVKARIKKYYQRDASVIYPSINDKFFLSAKPIPTRERKSFLVVSRFVPYKKVDLVIKVFNKLELPLEIIGTGSEMEKLKKIAKKHIKFLGEQTDDQLIEKYAHAKAVIFPQKEDFGLVPLEAQACGTPVIAYESGGAKETVISKKTGIFFKYQTIESLSKAILKFPQAKISSHDCKNSAKRFSEAVFITNFSDKVCKLWENYRLENKL